MMSNKQMRWLCAAALLLVGSLPGFAQNQEIAHVKVIAGEALVQRGAEQLRVKAGDALYESDVVKTGADGTMGITFVDNTVFTAGPGSELSLKHFRFNASNQTGEMLADIKHGTLSVVSGQMLKGSPGAMKIKTPTAVLNVRGTTFLVKID